MAALIIAIFPQNSSRGNREEQQDRTDPNSRFELARKPAWLLAFRQFGLPKWKHDFECGPFNHLGTSPCIENRSPDLQPAYSLFGKTVSILLAFYDFCTFSKSCNPLRHKDLRFSTVPS